MKEQIQKKLNDSKVLRWSVLALVAFTMLCGYFLTDVMSPLKPMLEKELLWDSLDYGIFTSAYGWFNVFAFMLIIGGIILDKMGVRFTGMGACLLMVLGCGLKYYAISTTFAEGSTLLGMKTQVGLAALGYAIFGVGVEIAGITVSKIIVKWFKGKEMALAMGMEMATARLGTMLALAVTVPIATFFGITDDEGVAKLTEMGEPYKVELCKEHSDKGEKISFYKQGEFIDLCAGPHLMSVAPVKAFKLTNCTGAYWRGDSKGKQLCRIYGTAFPKASELEAYLKQVEEAKNRDHNKIGRELEYFTTVDYIGQGLPILLPKGAKVIQLMQRWVEDVEASKGCQLTKTPYMAKRELYKISGHWDHYLDGMFVLGDPNDEEKECFALRPMTCPFQYQVFLNRQRSYRDLPMRLTETSTLFRNEDSGEMHGLIRVRQFTISEGHYIVRPEQLEDEFRGCLELAKYFLGTVGLLEDCTFRFSQWDPANPKNKYEGTPEQWEHAQAAMKTILEDLGIEYTIGIDEAAYSGNDPDRYAPCTALRHGIC